MSDVVETSAQITAGEPFTLGRLRDAMKLMEDIPPAPMFASWEHFPREHALTFEWKGKHYAGAHPDFWAQIPATYRGRYESLFAVEICDFSLPYFKPHKAEFIAALASTMGTTPTPTSPHSPPPKDVG